MNPPRRHLQQAQPSALPPREGAAQPLPSTSNTRDRVVPARPALTGISILHRHSRSMGSVPTTSAASSSSQLGSSSGATTRANRHVSDAVGLDCRFQDDSAAATSGLGTRATRIFAAMKRANSFKKQGRSVGFSVCTRFTTQLSPNALPCEMFRTRHALTLPQERGMFSTPEEHSASFSSSSVQRRGRTRAPDVSLQPPSISQIAMGLHTSRTPHLGPSHSRRLSSEPPNSRTLRSPRAASSTSSHSAQPLRSSLKKPSTLGSAAASPHPSRSASPSASASISLTASTGSGPPTPSSTFSRISSAITNRSRSRLGKFERFLGIKSQPQSALTLSNYSSDVSLETPRKSVRFKSIAEQEVLERVVISGPPENS